MIAVPTPLPKPLRLAKHQPAQDEDNPITRRKHSTRPAKPEVSENSVRWRQALVSLGIALFLLVISIPLITTLIEQVQLMAARPLDKNVYPAVIHDLRAFDKTFPIRKAFNLLSRHDENASNLASLQRADRDNGLYAFLELIPLLRARSAPGDPKPETTDPALTAALQRCPSRPPIRLYATDERNLARAGFARFDIDPRRQITEADLTQQLYPGVRGAGLDTARELGHHLLAQAEAWRHAGQTEHADRACAAIVKLMTDLVQDSPDPTMALLAADLLPPALRELKANHAIERIEAFRTAWRSTAGHREPNLIPRTGEVALCPEEHERVIRSSLAATTALAALLVTLACLAVCLIIAGVTRPQAPIAIIWRWNGKGLWLAPIVACTPLILLLALIYNAHYSMAWLLSYPSLPAAVGCLLVLPLPLGFASWLCLRSASDTIPSGHLPFRAVLATTVAALAVIIATAVLWSPRGFQAAPAGIRWFRRLAPPAGFVSCVIMTGWWITSYRRRRRVGWQPGAWARAHATVASLTLLAMAVLSLVVLGINQYRDRQHRAAFIQAATDPIADRLGNKWFETYFSATGDLSHLRKAD